MQKPRKLTDLEREIRRDKKERLSSMGRFARKRTHKGVELTLKLRSICPSVIRLNRSSRWKTCETYAQAREGRPYAA